MGKIVLIKNENSNGIRYDFYDEDDKKGTVNIPNDIPSVNFNNNNNNKHLKGFIFDSLVYRYKNAREKLAIYEEQEKKKKGEGFDHIEKIAQRDIMKFIEILNEAIGDHD